MKVKKIIVASLMMLTAILMSGCNFSFRNSEGHANFWYFYEKPSVYLGFHCQAQDGSWPVIAYFKTGADNVNAANPARPLYLGALTHSQLLTARQFCQVHQGRTGDYRTTYVKARVQKPQTGAWQRGMNASELACVSTQLATDNDYARVIQTCDDLSQNVMDVVLTYTAPKGLGLGT